MSPRYRWPCGWRSGGWSFTREPEYSVCPECSSRVSSLLAKESRVQSGTATSVLRFLQMSELRDAIQALLQPSSSSSHSPAENFRGASSFSSAAVVGSVCALQPSTEEAISLLLPRKLAKAFRLLPAYARRSLLLQHDCRGRPLLPTIEAEALLAQRVEKELRKR